MPVFSIFKRKQNTATAGTVDEAATVLSARSRARHRLMGAVVLVVAGIIAFPLLFDSQPRPLAVDIPIEAPAKRDLVPLPMPAPAPAARARSSAPVITERAAESPPTEPIDATPPSAAAAAAAKPPLAASKPAPNSAAERAVATAPPVPAAAPAAERSAEARRAQSLLEGSDTLPAPNPPAVTAAAGTDAAAPRFVVQAGAYGDASSLHDARQKVERLGLKTYTQVVQTDAGTRTRVRVGPFATRDEAEKAAQRIKGSGLAVNILAL